MNTLFSGREFPQKIFKSKIGYKRAKKNSWKSFTTTQREEPHFSGDRGPKEQRKYREGGEKRKDLAFRNTNL